jgi:hypothetical protein
MMLRAIKAVVFIWIAVVGPLSLIALPAFWIFSPMLILDPFDRVLWDATAFFAWIVSGYASWFIGMHIANGTYGQMMLIGLGCILMGLSLVPLFLAWAMAQYPEYADAAITLAIVGIAVLVSGLWLVLAGRNLSNFIAGRVASLRAKVLRPAGRNVVRPRPEVKSKRALK